jgi:predicted RNase H-like nuclease (RuvC/YqgF family)
LQLTQCFSEFKAKLQQDVLENNSEKYQREIDALQSQLSFILKSQDEENHEKKKIEENFKATIQNLEQQLQKRKDQEELINKMIKLEVATEKLDRISEGLNDNLKDLQITDLLKLQSETEEKLNNIQIEVWFKNYIQVLS